MILVNKNKRLAYLLGALTLMLTASAVWAQILDVTGSPNQLGIAAVYLTAPGNSLGAPVPCFNGDSSPSRYLNFVGKNFNTGNSPKLLIDLGVVGPYTNWSNLTPVDTSAATLAVGPYYVQIDCSQFSILSIHRLVVSTGNGPVYNDAVSFDFSVVGPRGLVGAIGATGATGNGGPKGDTGPQGPKGAARTQRQRLRSRPNSRRPCAMALTTASRPAGPKKSRRRRWRGSRRWRNPPEAKWRGVWLIL